MIGASVPVPADSVAPWQEVGLGLDLARLFARIDLVDEGGLRWSIELSLRTRVPTYADVAWGHRSDSERELWVPLLDGSRGSPLVGIPVGEPRLLHLWDLACRSAAQAVLDHPGRDLEHRYDGAGRAGFSGIDGAVPSADRTAWAEAVASGLVPPPLAPWEAPEVVAFLRSWIELREAQLGRIAPWAVPSWPADWPPLSQS